ncbi:hypothetical protein WJX74_008477 [Apatococcus lobatus]|uniref:Uncharacterized protein n=1 Tax=Apatococcus lobatus TaxID=904363 RepID=A0AAW1QIL6_9CHLO
MQKEGKSVKECAGQVRKRPSALLTAISTFISSGRTATWDLHPQTVLPRPTASTVLQQQRRQLGRRPSHQLANDSSSSSIRALADPAAESAVEDLIPGVMTQRPQVVSFEDVAAAFTYTFDRFQQQAVEKFLAGHSVVVCAPTASGKTAIAEAAAIAVLARGQRVIYTTPLKALSNQKLVELRDRFGHETVGLQTGDASLNMDAQVVVMTTEILRNIMYRADAPSGEEAAPPVRATEDRLADVGMVVLDEVHYLGDPDRGSVWEEVIINCPTHIQLLCLSATVANPDDLGGWISEVHGTCETVVTRHRPIPLSWHYGHNVEERAEITPLPLQRLTREEKQFKGFGRAPVRMRKLDDQDDLSAMLGRDEGLARWRRIPDMPDLVLRLREADFLPAIWFIFSRAGCDTAAITLLQTGIKLVTTREQAIIDKELQALRELQPEAVRSEMVPALHNGITSHHAGCLPGWKGLIERLFQQGALKLVFATDTLAAGINMPARTTVISSLSRRRNVGHALLLHNELLQMAGRAGRRGFDTAGQCIILQNRYEEAEVALDIIARGPEPLQSQFSIGYNMVLNLLHRFTLPEAQAFVQRSFNAFLRGEGWRRKLAEIETMEERVRIMLDQVAASDGKDSSRGAAASYDKAKGRLKEERRALKLLMSQATDERGALATQTLGAAGLPHMVGLSLDPTNPDDFQLQPAMVVAQVSGLDNPSLSRLTDDDDRATQWLCLTSDNRMLIVQPQHIGGFVEGILGAAEGGRALLAVSQAADTHDAFGWRQSIGGFLSAPGTATTAAYAARIPGIEAITPLQLSQEMEEAVEQQQDRAAEARKAMLKLKAEAQAFSGPGPNRLRIKAESLQRRANEARESLEDQQGAGTWRSFQNIMAMLSQADALDGESIFQAGRASEAAAGAASGAAGAEARDSQRVQVLPLGDVARQINGTNELWLATVLTSPELQSLTPPQLAALLSGVTSEMGTRSSPTVRYEASATVVACMEALEPARLSLYQLQMAHGLEIPLAVDLRLAGLVEAWANGAAWKQIMQDCNLDDGDVARLFSRTADLLRQAAHCPGIEPDLRRAARRAMRDLDRPPISDLVM